MANDKVATHRGQAKILLMFIVVTSYIFSSQIHLDSLFKHHCTTNTTVYLYMPFRILLNKLTFSTSLSAILSHCTLQRPSGAPALGARSFRSRRGRSRLSSTAKVTASARASAVKAEVSK